MPSIGAESVPSTVSAARRALVRADLHREGLRFPSSPDRGYLETEGLAVMAKDMGITCHGLPGLRIMHADA